VSRDARIGMQNGNPKSNAAGVADSTVVPVMENVPATVVAVSVEKLIAPCARAGPVINAAASHREICSFMDRSLGSVGVIDDGNQGGRPLEAHVTKAVYRYDVST
jgi:hypothetical protein